MTVKISSQDACASTSRRGILAIRGGAVRIAGYLSGVLISLAAAALLVRHLGIPTFGRYVTVISLLALMGGVTEAGIAVYGIREFTNDAVDRHALLADLLGLRVALALVGVAFATGFAVIVGYSHTLVLGTLIVGAALLLQVVNDVLSVPLQVELRLAQLALVDIVRRLTGLALIAALVLLGADILPFFAVTIAASAIALTLLVRLVRAHIEARIHVNMRGWSGVLRDSLPFAVAASVGAVYFYVTIVLMSLIATALQTGYFATSFRVTQVALAVPVLALTAIFPLIARSAQERRGDFGHIMAKVLDASLIFGPWMSVVIALGADFIISLIAGRRGNGATLPLRIQGLVLTASFISTSCMLGLVALHRYRQMIIASCSALVVNIALGLALIPSLGARGGAVADVVTEMLVAAGIVTALMRLAPEPINTSVIPSVGAATALAAAVALAPVASIVRATVATFIYFGTLWVTGSIPEELTHAALRLGIFRSRAAVKPGDLSR